jgi:hypothetical protein
MSMQYDTTYRVPVSGDFTCGDILAIFREFFKLPESKKISSEGINVSLSHAVLFNGEKRLRFPRPSGPLVFLMDP